MILKESALSSDRPRLPTFAIGVLQAHAASVPSFRIAR